MAVIDLLEQHLVVAVRVSVTYCASVELGEQAIVVHEVEGVRVPS